MATVFLVEDDESLSNAVAYNLRRAGYDVVALADGEAALRALAAHKPDLIVLDIMLPTIDGFEVCRQVRRTSSVPILVLTARDDEVDRVVGLELGADDYLTKPFSMRELLARVKALLRRRALLIEELRRDQTTDAERLTVGAVTIDLAARRVWRSGQEVALKPKEYELLVYLARHQGRVCTSESLLRAVWGYEGYGDTRTLAVHIHGLREKLEDDPRHPGLIETVRGIGYRLSSQATS